MLLELRDSRFVLLGEKGEHHLVVKLILGNHVPGEAYPFRDRRLAARTNLAPSFLQTGLAAEPQADGLGLTKRHVMEVATRPERFALRDGVRQRLQGPIEHGRHLGAQADQRRLDDRVDIVLGDVAHGPTRIVSLVGQHVQAELVECAARLPRIQGHGRVREDATGDLVIEPI